MTELMNYPVFDSRPSDEYVSSWEAYIDGTGYPERFQNVTTTHPAKDLEIVILSSELRVPVLRRENQEWVPCPICSPGQEKFKTGRMAWFPSEKTVRFIGHQCAKKHFGENYKVALDRFGQIGRLRALTMRWNVIVPHIELFQNFIERLLPAANSASLVRQMMEGEASGFAHWLYRELTRGAPGEIKILNDTGLKDRKGNAVFESYVLGKVMGLDLLNDGFQPDAYLLVARQIIEDMKAPLPEWSAAKEDKEAEAEILRRGTDAFYLADYILTGSYQIEAAVEFLQEENLALLERWSQNNQSPFRSLICRKENKCLRVRSVSYAGTHYANPIIGQKLEERLPARPPELFEMKSLVGLSGKKLAHSIKKRAKRKMH